jgi:hypothetical protein
MYLSDNSSVPSIGIGNYGFTRLIHDQCVYVKQDLKTNAKTFVATYVDDIIVTGNSSDEIRKTIDYFATEFKKISASSTSARLLEESVASLVSI